jgi:predicted transcriptional regulator
VSTTIRVSERTRDRLARLAEATGRPMSQLLDEAADLLERRVFFEELGARYGELRKDRGTWEEIQAERRAQRGSGFAPPA